MTDCGKQSFPSFAKRSDGRETTIDLAMRPFRVKVTITGLNQKQRRAFAEAIALRLAPHISSLAFCWIRHDEIMPAALSRQTVISNLAVELGTERGKFGLLLRMKRHQLKMTQKELAVLLEMSATHLSHLERGRHTPHPSTLKKIKRVLNVEMPDLPESETLDRNPHYWPIHPHVLQQQAFMESWRRVENEE